ncbi:hypothetical protein RFI_28848, partial [Reticulomyxa filosa]
RKESKSNDLSMNIHIIHSVLRALVNDSVDFALAPLSTQVIAASSNTSHYSLSKLLQDCALIASVGETRKLVVMGQSQRARDNDVDGVWGWTWTCNEMYRYEMKAFQWHAQSEHQGKEQEQEQEQEQELVRNQSQTYGGCVYMDDMCQVLHITYSGYCYQANDRQFEHMATKCLSSLWLRLCVDMTYTGGIWRNRYVSAIQLRGSHDEDDDDDDNDNDNDNDDDDDDDDDDNKEEDRETSNNKRLPQSQSQSQLNLKLNQNARKKSQKKWW